jgi:hypothetical protein
LVTARYIHLAKAEGPGPQWTLAVETLARTLERLNPPAIFVVDWGILDPLRLLGAGRLPLLPATETIAGEIERFANDARLQRLKRGALVVTHPDKLLNFPGANAAIWSWAESNGLRKIPVESVRDAFGVTQFEIYRFEARLPVAPAAGSP